AETMPERGRALDARQEGAVRIPRVDHRPELVDRERPAAEARARLPEDHGRAEANADERGNHGDQRRQDDRGARGGDVIEQALGPVPRDRAPRALANRTPGRGHETIAIGAGCSTSVATDVAAVATYPAGTSTGHRRIAGCPPASP